MKKGKQRSVPPLTWPVPLIGHFISSFDNSIQSCPGTLTGQAKDKEGNLGKEATVAVKPGK